MIMTYFSLISQLHNLSSDVHVASQFGQAPKEALSLLIEPDKIPSELRVRKSSRMSSEYSTEVVMKEFRRDNFVEMMYDLNKSMDT